MLNFKRDVRALFCFCTGFVAVGIAAIALSTFFAVATADTPLTTFAAAARARGIVGAAPAVVQTVALTTSLNVVYTSVAGNTTVDATMCPGVSALGPGAPTVPD